MSSTTLSNVNFLSQVFKDTMAGEFTHRLGFLSSGVLAEAPEQVVSSNDRGYTVAIPKWDILSGSTDQITTSLTTTVNNVSDMKDVGVWVEREKAWGADQMIKVVADKDPTKAIAEQLAQYWAGELHRVALAGTLAGNFATALATTHSTSTTYSGANITIQGGVAAKLKLGDNQDLLSAFLANSKVVADMTTDRIITYDNGGVDTLNTGQVPMFLGCKVTSTDKLTASSSVYPSYFASQGAMIYKFRNRTQASFNNSNVFTISAGGLNIEVEIVRVSTTAGGQDLLVTRASFMTHVPGVAWQTGSVSSNPTDAQLATGSNWSKVATDDKTIRIVQLKTL